LDGVCDTPLLQPGLYIVATPIGNLGTSVGEQSKYFRDVWLLPAKIPGITGKLLYHLGLKRPMRRYDDHASDASRESCWARR